MIRNLAHPASLSSRRRLVDTVPGTGIIVVTTSKSFLGLSDTVDGVLCDREKVCSEFLLFFSLLALV